MDIGVDSTARDAWQHNYSVVIAEDACASMGANLHQFSVEKVLRRVARVRSTAEVMAGTCWWSLGASWSVSAPPRCYEQLCCLCKINVRKPSR